MRRIALIDADSLIWTAAYGKDNELQVDEYYYDKLETILLETGCNYYKMFVGGENNFRYHIRGDYKSNRKDRELPTFFRYAKDVLKYKYNAFVANGLEVDDCIVATYNKLKDDGDDPVVCTIDKDYKIKPLNIYKWETHLKDTIFPSMSFTISQEVADYNFAVMMITGDAGDFIKTCDGIGAVGAKKLLLGKTKYGMIRALVKTYRSLYGSARWRARMTEVYHLLNLIGDYNRVKTPKDFDFTL